jgi:hypothetical protein
MKKSNRKFVWIGLGILALALIGIILFFSLNLQSIIGNIEEQTKNEVWNENNVILKSAFFGSIGSGQGSEYLTSGKYAQICGNNDAGIISLSNTYSISNSLSLISSISGSKFGCGDANSGNYIYADIDLPKGTFYGDYDLSSASGDSRGGESGSHLIITSDKGKLLDLNSFACGNADYCMPPRALVQPNTFSFNITEPTTIHVKLITYKAYSGGATGNINLNFEKYIEPVITTENLDNSTIISNYTEGNSHITILENSTTITTINTTNGNITILYETKVQINYLTIGLIILGFLIAIFLILLIVIKVKKK